VPKALVELKEFLSRGNEIRDLLRECAGT